MPYWMKAAIIALIAAVAAFFVADLIIPERSDVVKRNAASEAAPPQTQDAQAPRDPLVKPGEEVPVVTIDAPQPADEPAPPPAALTMDAQPAASEKAADMKKSVTLGKVSDARQSAVPLKITDTKKAPVPEKTADAQLAALPEKPADTKKRETAAQGAAMPYKIDRAVICEAIVDRNPANVTNTFPRDARQAVYFTHVVGSRDTTAKIIHRWYHKGQLIQTSILPVGSPSWRTHSKRYLFRSHEPSGEWRVEAVEPKSGTVLETATFTVE